MIYTLYDNAQWMVPGEGLDILESRLRDGRVTLLESERFSAAMVIEAYRSLVGASRMRRERTVQEIRRQMRLWEKQETNEENATAKVLIEKVNQLSLLVNELLKDR